MRIGIIGGGAAGMTTAWLLQHDHDVTILEAAPQMGGHALTYYAEHEGQKIPCETGLSFIFDSNYPTLHALLRSIQLKPFWRPVNLTIRWPQHGDRTLVLPPRTPRHWCRQLVPRNLRDTLYFAHLMAGLREASATHDESLTIADWGARVSWSKAFSDHIFIPFLAASWGAPVDAMRNFPAWSVGKVLQRPAGPHGIFQFEGGITTYINALQAALPKVTLRTATPARRAEQVDGVWHITDARAEVHTFDRIVLATTSRDAARLLVHSTHAAAWHRLLAGFEHFPTTIVFHKDTSFMPTDRRDWSSLNQTHDDERPWTTEWSGQPQDAPVFRTWQPEHRPPPRHELHRVDFHHPIVDLQSAPRQREIAARQGEAGVYVVGMYVVDVDNHESAIASAVPVARALAPDSPTLAQLDEELRRPVVLATVPSSPPKA